MPCRDGGPTELELRQERQRDIERRASELAEAAAIPTAKLLAVEAMLCAIVTQLEVHYRMGTIYDFLNHCNWTEAGVTIDEFTNWWNKHKAQDIKRKKAEADASASDKFSEFLNTLSDLEKTAIINRMKIR